MKKIAILLFIILVIVAIPLGVYLVKQRQEIRKRASTPSGTALVSLSPASGNYEVGQSFPVSVYFNPVSIPISSIAVRITYPLSGNLTASSLQINPSFLTSGNWMCPVKTITPTGSQVEIDIACANITTEGFTAASDTLLASFNLVANEVPAVNPVVLSFDPQQSKIQSKIDNVDILLTPTSNGSYTIGGGATATATPTTIPPEATATPTESAGVTNTPTPTQSAGEPTNTPTPTRASPTATPTTASGGGTSSNPVSLSSISSSSNPPTLSGTAAPGAKITITVQSTPITGMVYADAAGNWSWTPPSELETGSHTATVTATDSSGQTTTDSVSFTVADAEDLPATGFLTPTVLSLLSGLLLLFLGLAL